MRPFAEIERMDAELVELTRGASSVRLSLGELLEQMVQRGAHLELGFSSIEAYVRERAGRSGRWALESRTLARRLRALPTLRAAVGRGEVGWCMAELVARHATPDNEAELAARAATSTVRQMRACLEPAPDPSQMSARDGPRLSEWAAARFDLADLEMCTLTLSMSQADAWRFEWTRSFAEHVVGCHQADAILNALAAETFASLHSQLPGEVLERVGNGDAIDQQLQERERAWREQLAAWREESERRCEPNFAERLAWHGVRPAEPPTPPPQSAEEMDARAVELGEKLAQRDVRLARAAKQFHEAEGWRRLGYSTEAQYARERLGISASCFKAHVALARRLHPPVCRALEAGRLRYEAALLITRIANAETAHAWVERAKARTFKHLFEEVRAAELLSGIGGSAWPPPETTVRAVHELEARMLAGERDAVLDLGGQMSAELAPGVGRVSARLRVSRDTAKFWRALEEVTRRYLSRDQSFTRLACDAFWETWKHLTQSNSKWSAIYARDRQRCTSPVCSRRDLTPHHVKFRSQGGSDEDENMTSLCSSCHIEGVHQGRIAVSGRAPDLTWRLGRGGKIVVEGRVMTS